MNSINRDQPEHNVEALQGEAAIKRIRAMIEQSPAGFFCTTPVNPTIHGVRPMTVQEVDAQGTLWFLSANDSEHDRDIAANSLVRLYFQGSKHSDFLHLDGRASISADRERIKQLWKPVMKTWFPQGVDDPRISVISVVPVSGYYWDTKHGDLIAGVKMLIGAAVGVTLDDSIEGEIAP